jgi:predicted Zn-dependent protease
LTFNDFLAKTRAMQGLFRRPFGPDEELEADRDGATWAYKLGYDPRELGVLFEELSRKGNPRVADFMPAFFRTHPLHADRIREVRNVYADLQRADPQPELFIGVENLQRRSKRER